MKKAPKGTTRGVFVIDKAGKVLAAEAGVGPPNLYNYAITHAPAEFICS